MPAGVLKFGNKKDAAVGRAVLLAVAKALKKAAKATEKGDALEINLTGGRQKKGAAAKPEKGKKGTKTKGKMAPAAKKAVAKPVPKAKPVSPLAKS